MILNPDTVCLLYICVCLKFCLLHSEMSFAYHILTWVAMCESGLKMTKQTTLGQSVPF